jgi:hypothetical protein
MHSFFICYLFRGVNGLGSQMYALRKLNRARFYLTAAANAGAVENQWVK